MTRSLNVSRCPFVILVVLVGLAGWLSEAVAADITLSWTDNSNDESGFLIQRKTGTSGTFAEIATVGTNVGSYVDTGLAASTTFCYRIRAFNSAGNSAFTPEACKTTPSGTTTFNFSLAHGGDKSVTRGQSVSNVISATLVSGSSQSVTFLTSGLPTGVTASYATSSSCTPTCSRTLNITTLSSTPTGTYSITVTGNGGGLTRTAAFNLAVGAASSTPSGSTITLEAEAGVLIAPMVVRSSGTASGGQYVEVPEADSANYDDSTAGGPGQVEFTINISQAETRALWARTIALDGGADSFYVTRNGALLRLWAVPRSTTWQWNKVADLSLAAGSVRIAFRQREDGTKLDAIVLTSDPNFNPGSTSSPNLSGDPSVNTVASASASTFNQVVAIKIGIYRPATGEFFLDRDGNGLWEGCNIDLCLQWLAQESGFPVAGDWDGTGASYVGTFDLARGQWFLDRNGNGSWDSCNVDKCLSTFGLNTDLPVAGDWDGSGKAKIGFFRPATGEWVLDMNGNGGWDGCNVDKCFSTFGQNTNLPIAGDWDGSGKEKIGVFRFATGEWVLDMNGNGSWDGCNVDKCLSTFGQMNDLPVAGDWDESGKAKIGVFRPSTGEWFFDMNGNGNFEGCTVDACITSFGQTGDLPVVGNW